MVLFMALIVPMPFTIKRKMFNFLAESPIVAKLQYGMKVWRKMHPSQQTLLTPSNQITFIFILILFLDSVNRVYRVQVEMSAYSKSGGGAAVYVSPPQVQPQSYL
jgi:B-cell receptor-associated protein 31